jgi:heptosyltransferase II
VSPSGPVEPGPGASRRDGAGRIAVGEVRRALVRCPNWLGDTVMALPAIRALAIGLRGAEIWCLGPWTDALLAEEPGIARRLGMASSLPGRLAQARDLRRARFDLAVLLTNSFETGLLAWLAGARWRLGYRADGRRLLLTHALALPEAPCHQVDQYLALLAPLGLPPGPAVPTLAPRPEVRASARRLLAEVGIGPGMPAVGIQLGAAFGPSKLWPPERLADLASRLDAHGVTTVFLGPSDARALLGQVEARMGRAARSLVGRDSPALLPAVLAELSALVASDSGPAHVAGAVGIPTVTLFGPTDPRLTAPRGPRATAIWRRPVCAPCFRPRCPIDHRCLRGVEVEDVVRTVLGQLAGSVPGSPE